MATRNNKKINSNEKSQNTQDYLYQKEQEEKYINSIFNSEEFKQETFRNQRMRIEIKNKKENNIIEKIYDEKIMYDDFYDNLFNKKEYYQKSINKTSIVNSHTIKNIKRGDKNKEKEYEQYDEYEEEYDIYNDKKLYESFYDSIDKTHADLVEKTKEIPEHLKAIKNIEDIIVEYASHVNPNSKAKNKQSSESWSQEDIQRKIFKEQDIQEELKRKEQKKLNSPFDFIPPNINKNPVTPEQFEKKKFIEASLFMKIGHVLGLSLRNKYYKNLDTEVRKALDNNEVYRVLEAQKNGYYLGKSLNKLTLEKLYKELTTHPLKLIEELVKRDVMLSFDNLSLVLLSPKGQDLLNGTKLESYPNAKELYQDLIKKENFIYANKNLWLKTLSDKELFLQENNPLFYHDKMLSVCDKSELIGVKKRLEQFLQEEDVLNSISKNKLIDKMLLKINLQLGQSIELEHMIADLPEVAQNLYKSIKEINFSEEDIQILKNQHNYEYELVDKRMPEAIMKYISVDSQYRNTLKNTSGKTAENLLIETLENILITKKDLNLIVNQSKLSDLSVTRRYTDSIRGEIGRPSIVTLKTLQQLKESGELNDLVNETILETINRKNNSENKENENNYETIINKKGVAIKVSDVRMSLEKNKLSKKLKI